MGFSDNFKELFWKDYVSRAESYEAKTIHELQMMYLGQKEEALANLRNASQQEIQLIDLRTARKSYVEKITPILTQVMAGSIKNGRELLEPPTPHKAGELLPLLSSAAIAWLKTRIGWAADQIGEESASRLAQVLAQGYEQGLSTDQIANNITQEFDYFSDTRAKRIARTEIMQASAQGAIQGYQDAGVEKLEFYPARDERECPDCMALDGEVFSVADSVGVITVHPQCRCVWLPVVA